MAGVAGGFKGQRGISLMVGLGFGSSQQGGFDTNTVYAADMGAHISSNSWSYSTNGYFPPGMKAAIDYALKQGVLVVYAAGNRTCVL